MKRNSGYSDYEFVADLYDYVIPYRERQDVSFFVEAAKEADGRVLELGCGTGRVLIPTARAGVEITGLDASRHMLAVCKIRLQEESAEVQSRVKLVEGDMRDFSMDRSFSLITIPFRPFQHLTTVEDQLDCLGSIQRHLKPGGRLILDLFNPSLEALTRDNLGQEIADEPEFSMPDGRKVKRSSKIVSRDHFNQLTKVELIYDVTYRDGREERLIHAFPMRYLYRFEAEHLLARAGFEVENVYADYDKRPYGSTYPGELLIVAHAVS